MINENTDPNDIAKLIKIGSCVPLSIPTISVVISNMIAMADNVKAVHHMHIVQYLDGIIQ